MLLIPDNTTLCSFIPNTFASIEGEPSLFDRIRPFLIGAEHWFTSELVPVPVLENVVEMALSDDDPLYFLPRRIVALKAWIDALPSVDVVISANGVGVIETNTLKPASKAKIDRLLESLSASLDDSMKMFMPLLPSVPEWLDSDQAASIGSTLFPSLTHLAGLGIFTALWQWRQALVPLIADIEAKIADEWISEPVMARLRRVSLLGKYAGCHQEINRVIANVRTAVLAMLRKAVDVRAGISALPSGLDLVTDWWRPSPELERAAAIIRANPCVFPDFADSDTARRLAAPVFKNRMDSTAYFF